MDTMIDLKHGDGGTFSNQLLREVIFKHLKPSSQQVLDAALLGLSKKEIAFTTDSFVIKPITFPGGDIGKLSVCGTINDLVAVGAKPVCISLSLIIEEGFKVSTLDQIMISIKKACDEAHIKVVTGDTKVVEVGKADGIFINTAGIGLSMWPSYPSNKVEEGDLVIITGGIGEHGATIATTRFNVNLQSKIKSDCFSLHPLIHLLENEGEHILWMRDPTRGGLATILNEFTGNYKCGVLLEEDKVPICDEVKGVTNLLGLDPYYLACEGRMVLVVKQAQGDRIIEKLHSHQAFKNTACIGRVTFKEERKVLLKTNIGGTRRLTILEQPMLPRIC